MLESFNSISPWTLLSRLLVPIDHNFTLNQLVVPHGKVDLLFAWKHNHRHDFGILNFWILFHLFRSLKKLIGVILVEKALVSPNAPFNSCNDKTLVIGYNGVNFAAPRRLE
jgi:hypothetical protein